MYPALSLSRRFTATLRAAMLFIVILTLGCSERDLVGPEEPGLDGPEFRLVGPVGQVSAGGYHTCALGSDSTVQCWGNNDFRVANPPSGSFTQVSSGGRHTCALASAGSVECWGLNTSSQASPPAGSFTQVSTGGEHTCALAGDGSVQCWGLNTSSQASPPAGNFTQVSAGGFHTCALANDGSVQCWGLNDSGQASPPVGSFAKVSAGGFHTCAVASDGSVECWGSNSAGVASPPAGSFTQVSAGSYHTCAVASDGSVQCWGNNAFDMAIPPTGSFTQVSAGGTHTCAVASDGSVQCWGNDGFGQASLPAGSFTQVSPGLTHTCALVSDGSVQCWGGLASPPTGSFTEVTSGGSHACALASYGWVECWGSNGFGQASPPTGSFTQVSGGRNHSCALASDGSVQCWGSDGSGQASPPTGSFTQVSAGGDQTCALESYGSVQCWGRNDFGQASPPTGSFTEVSAGGLHACARLAGDGSVQCWGRNNSGQASPPAGSFTQVSAGNSHTCALASDGSVRCWGLDGNGQASPPTGRFIRLEAFLNRTCAVRADRTFECWGQFTSTTYVPTGAGAVLFDQGPRGDETNALRANEDVGPNSYETLQQIADGFAVPARVRLEGVSWEGSYFQTSLPFSTVAFRIQIYTQLPGTPIYDEVLDASAVQVGISSFGSPIYRFSASVAGPVLEPDVSYWVAILESDARTSVDFRWWKTANEGPGDYALRSAPSSQWDVYTNHYRHDFVLQLSGSAEPDGDSTPIGTNVTVSPVDETTGAPSSATITFDQVLVGGETTVQSGTMGGGGSPVSPSTADFRLGQPPTYYEITTTASFSGFVMVCINYSGSSYGNESKLKLLHREGSSWVDITDPGFPDLQNKIICGTTTSLSPFLVAEENIAPIVTAIMLPGGPIAVNTAATLSASFTDENPTDTHTAMLDWGTSTTGGSVSGSGGAGTVAGSHTYGAPGVYTIGVTVSDGGRSGSRSSALDVPAYIVVYDPSAGFVTGGGWINSPTGACSWSGCASDGSTIGSATFGFVSRYKKGANVPDGNTAFQFQSGGLQFKSNSYEWLVIAGARAKFKGEGTINGAGSYGFMITAIDAALPGGGDVDAFRIKIWESASGIVVYDNKMGESEDSNAATALGGGSIVIHNK